MIKKLVLLTLIIFFAKGTFAQKYFKIEGTKRIFISYGKIRDIQIDDSTSLFYYIKKNFFYIAVKSLNDSIRPYVKYSVLNKKDKVRIKSLGRGSDEIVNYRVIDVNLLKVEKECQESDFIKKILKIKQ